MTPEQEAQLFEQILRMGDIARQNDENINTLTRAIGNLHERLQAAELRLDELDATDIEGSLGLD